MQILETREEKRRQRRDRQKPDRQVYTPRKSQSTAYKIDIEIKPNIFWREQIREWMNSLTTQQKNTH
jgi:hypothetical protein